MASTEESRYRVDATGPAKEQVRELLAKPSTRSELQRVVDALEAILIHLATQPHDWGDPEYRTRKEGGMVYHGIVSPLIAWYAVYEPEKVVWLFDVQALPDSPLAK
jgi:hypothetical protein